MTAPMIDHYPRIRARHMRVVNARAILIWLAYTVAFAAVLGMAVDGWRRHEAMAIRYASMEAANEALVKCIQGEAIGMDDAVMRCNVREYKLLKPGPLSNFPPQAGERANVKSLLLNGGKS